MRISRFFYEGELNQDQTVILPVETSHYILNVLRLKVGSELRIFNGQNKEHTAKIIDTQKKAITLLISEDFVVEKESNLKIHLFQALSRNEKMDLVLQKAVELGVFAITPIITRYCNVKVAKERSDNRLLHWKKVIISACEQSGRTFVPYLHPTQPFTNLLSQQISGLKLFCAPGGHHIEQLTSSSQVSLVIGPEGGLSEDEIASLMATNFHSMSLGPRILRTETAALAAIAVLQSQWGDM